jgi:hypothetical protein
MFKTIYYTLQTLRAASPRQRVQILLLGLAVLAGVGAQGYEIYKQTFPKKEDLAVRIQTLTNSLNSAAKTISQIEDEIKQRQSLVAKLQRDADEASKLSTLNKDQLDAVAQLLRSQTESSFWSSQAIALFYAVFGVALSELYRFVMRWRARRRLATVE